MSKTKVNADHITAKTKLDLLIELLRRPQGATIAALSDATGWQAHSVRGAISGALRKAKGLAISSQKCPHGRIYRITEAPSA